MVCGFGAQLRCANTWAGRPFLEVTRVDLNEIAHKRRSCDAWISAFYDNFAWRWTPEPHYAYLRDGANELLLLGQITFEARNAMALAAFKAYQFHLQQLIVAEATYVYGFEYTVYEGASAIAKTGAEGHLFSIDAHQLLGCIHWHYGPEADWEVTKWVDFVEVHVGYLRGLEVERADCLPWRLQLTPNRQAKRWSAHPSPFVDEN